MKGIIMTIIEHLYGATPLATQIRNPFG